MGSAYAWNRRACVSLRGDSKTWRELSFLQGRPCAQHICLPLAGRSRCEGDAG
jgi:hypothetical protein